MTYTISKEFAWSSSHQLAGLAPGHQCGRLHGHNYVARVELTSELLDPTGFVVDYGNLAPIKAWIDTYLDHRHLNDLAVFSLGENPTAENLARQLCAVVLDEVRLPAGVQVAVAVSETPKTWATYRAEA